MVSRITRKVRTTFAESTIYRAATPGLCYNLGGVDFTAKPENARPARDRDPLEVRSQAGQVPGLLDKQQGNEDASRYCPVCSQRLESRRCKLICPVCGYYMSCADYY
ncbi:MAG TPA: hypothetical protein VJN89_23935 [Candidatus Acidoferrum sp.]|nr:hypothetical protein [Candidatus Acidoferrum sp.]